MQRRSRFAFRFASLLTGLTGLLATLVTTSSASADTVDGTRFDLRERTHAIDIRLEHGLATMVVTRTVENAAPKSDQAVFHIDMPAGGVATRLRTAGTGPHGEQVWFEGELMEAEAAAKKYQELTGIGGYYPKDPALLSWRSQRHLALQVFPVPSRATKTVEYTVRVPMEYVEGAYKLKLSKLGTDVLSAKVRAVAANPEEAIEINGVGVLPGTSVVASRDLEVVLKPTRSVPMLEGALASFGFAADRVLMHARVATAPKLGQIPAHAAVVVLIDTSRSVEEQLPNEIAAARAYLSHFPKADVEVMTFDRKVQSPFGGPLPVRDVLSKLYTFSPTPANGSQVDDAIARADARLAQSSAPVRRILLLTDLRTRDALTADKFGARTLASGALLHMATVSGGQAQLTRSDDSPWAKLPRASGGLYWTATCDASPNDSTTRTVFEEWVRPKRIEKITIRGMPATFSMPNELNEGEGIEHLDILGAPVSQVAIEGELWSKPVRWSMAPSADEAKKWAGLVFGSYLMSSLSEKEQMTLAMHGGAVSPVTSYLAIEPGVRPSTEGLEPGELGSGSGTGTGQGFGSGHGRLGGSHHSRVDPQAFLDAALKNAVAACSVRTGQAASAIVESTLLEVVDIHDVALTPTRDAKAESCIAEQMWSVSLPNAFDGEHDTWTVAAHP